MAFDIGIDFRATAGYVTDPAGTTYCMGDAYPTTRGGFTFGWLDSPGGNIRDRSASIDPRLAGINYHTNASKKKFKIDLPTSGSVDIYCAVGDAVQASLSGYLEVFDDTASLGVVVSKHTSMTAGTFYDATDTLYSSVNWPGSNAKATFTFATTSLIVAVSPGDSVGTNFAISHLRVVQAGSPPPAGFGKANVGGVWKTVNGISVNVGGVWKAVSATKVNVGGVWKALA